MQEQGGRTQSCDGTASGVAAGELPAVPSCSTVRDTTVAMFATGNEARWRSTRLHPGRQRGSDRQHDPQRTYRGCSLGFNSGARRGQPSPVTIGRPDGAFLDFPIRHGDVRLRRPRCVGPLAEAEVGDARARSRSHARRAWRHGWRAPRPGSGALGHPSGSIGNLIALMLHLERGDRFLAPAGAHVLSRASSAQRPGSRGGMPEALPLERRPIGRPSPGQVTKAAESPGPITFTLRAKLLCLENTHNAAGRVPVTSSPTPTPPSLRRRARQAFSSTSTERGSGTPLRRSAAAWTRSRGAPTPRRSVSARGWGRRSARSFAGVATR